MKVREFVTAFGIGSLRKRRGLRHVVAALLALAILSAGLGTAHAASMPAAAGAHHSHHAESGDGHHGHHQAQAPGDCDHAAIQGAAHPVPKQHETGGCCVNACFPPAMARETARVYPPRFEIVPVRPGADQAPALNSPNGLFRPPRAGA